MDIQLQELIDKIKKEGIESAQAGAAKLKAGAEAEAKTLLEEAKKQANALIEKAKIEAERSEKAGIASVEQACRNLVLAFRGEIQELLDKLVANAVVSSYSTDVIKEILPELVKNWAVKSTNSLSVILSEGDLKKIDEAFKAKLVSTLKGGVEFKANKSLDGGFRISEKDGAAFYDFSAESVAAMLSAYLNPKLGEILKKSVEGK